MNTSEIVKESSYNPEQEKRSDYETAWDSLAELSKLETWDEHLEKAENLKKQVEELTPDQKRLIHQAIKTTVDMREYSDKIFFRGLAQQEKIEREFNSQLSHIEDLEILIEAGDSRVERTSVKYQDQDIPVYILKGYPFKFLAHIINYRESTNALETGMNTADDLVNNPKKWFEPYQEPMPDEQSGGWVIDRKNARSNTLSTSYADGTLRSFDNDLAHGDGHRYSSIIYGFDHIRPTTLLSATDFDDKTPNYIPQGNGYCKRGIGKLADSIALLNTNKGEYQSSYDEVAMYRYDESGKPLELSFMVTDNLSILSNTEALPEEITLSSAVTGAISEKNGCFLY